MSQGVLLIKNDKVVIKEHSDSEVFLPLHPISYENYLKKGLIHINDEVNFTKGTITIGPISMDDDFKELEVGEIIFVT
jgi:hypothetical protein